MWTFLKDIFKTVFKEVFQTIIVRDPCKRCLVRMMCTEECPERAKFYLYTEGIPIYYRVMLFLIVSVTVGSIYSIIGFIHDMSQIIFK